MFLAWKEIRYAKTRFSLIVGVLVLVSYLVYFLTGLAFGLAQDNRTSVDKWEAQAIVLADEANSNIKMSVLPQGLIQDIEADDVAILGQSASVVSRDEQTEAEQEDNRISVTFFGIDLEQFLVPNIIEGEMFNEDFEAVADISLKEEYDIEIGDVLNIAGNDEQVTVVGFTENARFNVAPVLYTTISTYQDVRFEAIDDSDEGRVSAFIIRDDDLDSVELGNEDLELLTISEYIEEIPGYTAQVLTFALMIIFLIIIAAVVIGIFMFVLTVQKSSMFGVMKAQGISTKYIATSVVSQTFILAVIGVLIGLVLTIATAMVLPSVVPFAFNWYYNLIITVLIVLFALLGAFFSVRTVVKIDPLEAIG